ncbi:NUDIX hydrolase [Bradyrhizobium sp. dw_78]|uniref:NUDIX hydrolase n=1 Tax=Bradyrhizobium sp. dw_78 TaxID=2719793 RepID=UPI001BD3C64F|nr:NUDIX hydrolase [Bradyrhizobium sp. dw_78]
MARTPVLAAGGIVLRQEKTPLIAVVRLRKRDEWVLPKGKLDDGETPRAAAKREVLEETGHEVSVHEFLGTLVYESGGRSKVVHYWRMAAGNKPTRELMQDVRAVDWLPLNTAVERLSRGHERAFLANVGPIALKAATVVKAAPRSKVKPAAPEKRRSRRVAPPPAVSEPVPVTFEPAPAAPPPDSAAPMPEPMQEAVASIAADAVKFETPEVETPVDAMETEFITELAEPDNVASIEAPESTDDGAASPIGSLVQKMRGWLRRAA